MSDRTPKWLERFDDIEDLFVGFVIGFGVCALLMLVLS